MHLNKPANCVNSSTGQELSLQQQIILLIGQGHSNCDIALLTGAQPVYVRAVRSRATAPDDATKRKRIKGKSRPRPRQPNLRELALKLYDMRAEGRL